MTASLSTKKTRLHYNIRDNRLVPIDGAAYHPSYLHMASSTRAQNRLIRSTSSHFCFLGQR
ncbi:hypothetical protein BJX61DRAFT_514654 [Aspergillus egyptiacus]|nr:hypothetical protein BJX61DRAFT_514654 [Aspergillus egyptiacus]